MNPVNRDKFFFAFSGQFGPVADGLDDALDTILSFLEHDERMSDIRWVCYALATAWHETGKTMLPIKEFSRGKGLPYGKPDPQTGKTYYGRGYVQLTWKDNYAAMGKVCGADFVTDPDLVMKPEYAYRIMSYGMRNGSFTGAALSRYFNDDRTDPVSARKIINGLDCAEKIAQYYENFMTIFKEITDDPL